MDGSVIVNLAVGLFTAAVSAAASFGAVKFSLGSLTATVGAQKERLAMLEEGKSYHFGEISANLRANKATIDEHGDRLSELESTLSRMGEHTWRRPKQ